MNILYRKEEAGERIEVTMSWQKSPTLGSFYFEPTSMHVFFNIGIGRRTIEGLDPITDYNWYMPKLILPIVHVGGRIQKIQWIDIM